MATNTELEYLGRGATEQLVAEVKALLATKQDKGEIAGLPKVTSEDNGKVLSVAEGVWSAEDLPFYEKVERVPVLPEQTLMLEVSDGTAINFIEPAPFILVAGETYHVVLNGEECTRTCTVNASGCPSITRTVVDETGSPIAGTFEIAYGSPEYTKTEGGAILMNIHTPIESGTYTMTAAIYRDESVIKTIDPKFLPEGSSGGVSSWNDLTDKPFYEEGNLEVFLPEEEDSFELNGDFGLYFAAGIKPASLVIGETYTVYWDEKEYVCTAIDASSLNGGAEMIAIGNGVGFGLPGNNEPFAITTDESLIMFFVVDPTDTSTSHRVEIFKGAITLKTLDAKFLPMDAIDARIDEKAGSSGGSSLPEVTTDDAGKFLRVSSAGVWVVESVLNAEEASF